MSEEKKMEKNIKIICPTCNKSKMIPIPTEAFQSKESGALSILIPIGLVCEHEFHAYIDKNGVVRDYLCSDIDVRDGNDIANVKIQEISTKATDIDIEKLLKIISERDLRSIIYAGFLGSPLLILETDLNSERFFVFVTFLLKLLPETLKKMGVMPPEKYLDYEKTQGEGLKTVTVYNLAYNISVKKPFGDSESEPFNDIINMLKTGKIKLQQVLAKNYLDYLNKFVESFRAYENEKIDKVIKNLKKDFANQQNMITPATVSLLKKKLDFQRLCSLNDSLNRFKAK